ALDKAAAAGSDPLVRCAVLFSMVKPGSRERSFLEALRLPRDAIDIACCQWKLSDRLQGASHPDDFAGVFEACDYLRKPARFKLLLEAERHLRGFNREPEVLRLAQAWAGVDSGAVAKRQSDPRCIPAAIRRARLQSLVLAMNGNALS
ncbi:MAG: hypothetical protein HUK26_00960, partial [Duodenibacillus sp.]|nr:hypothetical protein [Duodenibacillus sp.]